MTPRDSMYSHVHSAVVCSSIVVMSDVTQILRAIEQGDAKAANELLALDEALGRLATVDTRAAEMVKLCFFVGLTQEEAARELGVSLATAERVWGFARSWLLREIRKETVGTSQVKAEVD